LTITAKGKGTGTERAGSQALALLAVPINSASLLALAEGPKSLGDLRREIGSPPHTTMRDRLRILAELGVVERRRGTEFPGAVGFELTAAGRDLLGVVALLAGWLESAPGGAREIGSVDAKTAIRALVDGWTPNIVRALAARPLSLTDLDGLIASLNYPALERRLTAMRLLGLVEAVECEGRRTPYRATDWLRRAIAPLAAAAQWEQRCLRGQAPPVTNRDVEAAFLLSMPLLRFPQGLSGSCRVAVEMGKRSLNSLAGAMVEVRGGKVTACTVNLEGIPDGWAHGSIAHWLAAVAKKDNRRLEQGGDGRLVAKLIAAFSEAFKPPPVPSSEPPSFLDNV
jgi:DNA-binding HxlR family transcriptional regulator